MATRNRYLAISAQQVDPLSWFTGPLVPLAFGVLIVIYGTASSIVAWDQASAPILQFVAVALCALACLVVHLATRPMRQAIGWGISSLALGLGIAGMTVSAIGYAGGALQLELWWAPGAFTLAICTLGPYLPARRLLILGSSAAAVAVVLSLAILHPTPGYWGPVGTAVVIAFAPALGIAATSTFSYAVVSTMLPMLESPSRILVAGQQAQDEAAQEFERVILARLTARAAPFLEGLADAGRITPEDRALAGQLARRLRDELVTQSNLSWLDSIASTSRLVVVDPDRLARRMNNAQRTALRGLLQAILDTPGTDRGSLMVDLRAADDGATAVGISLDVALPEGTRIMHLAPYYLTLRTAVDDLTIGRNGVAFRISAE